MTGDDPTPMRGGGLIRLFTRHPTASNMLMAIILITGFVALSRLNTQFFPDLNIDAIQISVAWPGASAEDVDKTVVQAIEPEVRFLDGVKRVRSTSSEGRAAVTLEFHAGSDMQKALSDVETAVAQVTTLPESSERPVISRMSHFETVSRVTIAGDYPLRALKAWAERIRDDLLARGIDKVDIVGVPEEEIWVEVEPATLRRLGLSINELARQIGASSVDLPAGDAGGGAERQVRALGLAETAEEVGDILVSLEDGRRVPLRQIASVREAHAEGGVTLKHEGMPAVEVHIQRASTADALTLAEVVDTYMAEMTPSLPQGLTLVEHDVVASLIESRIDLLVKNGLGGLAVVMGVLLLFLNRWVAVWVANGIFIAVMGTFVVMYATGQSINMISLFALIMALGIVVDDAIVVAEHAESRRRAGLPPVAAAEAGATRMAVPVFASSLTTLAAFLPLLLISDVIGQMIAAIPMVIVAALMVSLIECYLVLPGHLRMTFSDKHMRPGRFRRWFDDGFARFRAGRFRRMVETAVRWRYATIATAFGAVILAAGMLAGGRVPFVFFEAPEADKLIANFEMAAGTPRAETEAMAAELRRALRAAEQAMGGAPGSLVLVATSHIGSTSGGRVGNDGGDNLGSLTVELLPADQRDFSAQEMLAEWRRQVRPRAGLSKLTIRASMGGPPGADVDVRLWGGAPATLKAAAEEIKALIASYPGVSAIEDDLPYGKEEVVVSVSERGRAMGFSTDTVGGQLRDALQGAIAKRFPRGDEEVEVRVFHPRDGDGAAALPDLYLRAADGTQAPLSSIASMSEDVGFARIKREDGARQLAVTAEIDKAVATNDDIVQALRDDGIAEIAARHGVSYRFAGKAEEQAQTFADMKVGAFLGISGIYIILCWVFGSYLLPFAVILVVPLGFVGAVFGHWLLGYNMVMLSVITLVGLSGIIVNDAIILVETIKQKLAEDAHETEFEAIVDGTQDRLRAVILTSVTTIGGLAPLMFETSVQARFLIPMAITICFGLMVSTMLVLFVVPSLIGVAHDVKRLFGLERRPWMRKPEPQLERFPEVAE